MKKKPQQSTPKDQGHKKSGDNHNTQHKQHEKQPESDKRFKSEVQSKPEKDQGHKKSGDNHNTHYKQHEKQPESDKKFKSEDQSDPEKDQEDNQPKLINGHYMYPDKLKKANETNKIINQKYYEIKGSNVQINTSFMLEHSQFVSDKDRVEIPSNRKKNKNLCKIEVTHEKTYQAAFRIKKTIGIRETVVLNFASATSPGGGWLNGREAQEESITRQSTLYLSLKKFKREFYGMHSNSLKGNKPERFLYTDCMIYSPNVTVIRDPDTEKLLEKPFLVSVITSAAPNLKLLCNDYKKQFEDEKIKNKPKKTNMPRKLSKKDFIPQTKPVQYADDKEDTNNNINDVDDNKCKPKTEETNNDDPSHSNNNNQKEKDETDTLKGDSDKNKLENSINSKQPVKKESDITPSSEELKKAPNLPGTPDNKSLNDSSKDDKKEESKEPPKSPETPDNKSLNNNSKEDQKGESKEPTKSPENTENKLSNKNPKEDQKGESKEPPKSPQNTENKLSNKNPKNDTKEKSKEPPKSPETPEKKLPNKNLKDDKKEKSKDTPKSPETPENKSSNKNPKEDQKGEPKESPKSSNDLDMKFSNKTIKGDDDDDNNNNNNNDENDDGVDDKNLLTPNDKEIIIDPKNQEILDKAIEHSYKVLEERIKRILMLALAQGNKAFVLGAFGCGIFENDPDIVSEIFRKLLVDDRIGYYFDVVVFAIVGSDNSKNYTSFVSKFKKYLPKGK